LAEARNAADNIAYQAEKALRELGDKVPANDRQQIESKIQTLRETMSGEDLEQIKRQTEELQQASYALSQQLYAQQAQPQSEAPAGNAGSSNEEDVVEGEFREA
jgi:molecular chaperone DnaK